MEVRQGELGVFHLAHFNEKGATIFVDAVDAILVDVDVRYYSSMR